VVDELEEVAVEDVDETVVEPIDVVLSCVDEVEVEITIVVVVKVVVEDPWALPQAVPMRKVTEPPLVDGIPVICVFPQ
jgi:hypothetical protein